MTYYDKLQLVLFVFMIYNIINVFSLQQQIRDKILLKQNNICSSCYKPFSVMVPHEIHHINHNSSDNDVNNLVAVCCNCHASHHRYNKQINPYFPVENYINNNNNELPYYKTIKDI